ncbi:hypothetical protein BDR07DRAFT_139370 [Suillus spraguei]|nr:hypothetical protein BDR07DRAFT_139370 [Suillus spraguei]
MIIVRGGVIEGGIRMTVTLGEKLIAIGDENATVTIEETETEMTGEEMIVEGAATGIEIAMLIDVVTKSRITITANDAEMGTVNGEDVTDKTDYCHRSMLISILC